jgi:hypothetical protein
MTFTIGTQNIYGGNVQLADTINNFAHNNPDLNSELKGLLIELQTTIVGSSLATQDKQQAITAAQTLADVSKKPSVEQKSLVSETVEYFKKLSEDLNGIPETALKLAETAAKIALWFGV